MISIALLGAGRIGQIHGRTIAASKRARLAGIGDPFPDGANALSAATGAPVRPIDELIADKAIDAVLIATPTDTHADYIDRAAAAGKAILCEKPVDLNSARIKETLARVDEGRRDADDRLQPALRLRISRRCRSGSPRVRPAMSSWSASCRAIRGRRRSPTSNVRAGYTAT